MSHLIEAKTEWSTFMNNFAMATHIKFSSAYFTDESIIEHLLGKMEMFFNAASGS